MDTDRPLYESSAEESHIDGAICWSNIIVDFDVGLHYFRGTRGDPLLVPSLDVDWNSIFRPYFEQMDQVGLDLQYANEGWLLKFEEIAGDTPSEEYSAMLVGFEYTLYGIGGSTIDAGLLLEGHFDFRGTNAFNPLNRDFSLERDLLGTTTWIRRWSRAAFSIWTMEVFSLELGSSVASAVGIIFRLPRKGIRSDLIGRH